MTNNGRDSNDVVSKIPESPSVSAVESTTESEPNTEEIPPQRPPLPLQLNQDFNILTNLIQDNSVPINNVAPISQSESKDSLSSVPSEDIPPKVHPRRRSSDKSIEKRSSIPSLPELPSPQPNEDDSGLNTTMSPTLISSASESMLVDSEQTISVKERKQMFNRMASESDVLKTSKVGGNINSQVSVVKIVCVCVCMSYLFINLDTVLTCFL